MPNFIPKQSGAAKGLADKQDFIKKTVIRKENSMKDFAVRRDAALFASVSAGDPKMKELLKSDYREWREFFEEEYSPEPVTPPYGPKDYPKAPKAADSEFKPYTGPKMSLGELPEKVINLDE